MRKRNLFLCSLDAVDYYFWVWKFSWWGWLLLWVWKFEAWFIMYCGCRLYGLFCSYVCNSLDYRFILAFLSLSCLSFLVFLSFPCLHHQGLGESSCFVGGKKLFSLGTSHGISLSMFILPLFLFEVIGIYPIICLSSSCGCNSCDSEATGKEGFSLLCISLKTRPFLLFGRLS